MRAVLAFVAALLLASASLVYAQDETQNSPETGPNAIDFSSLHRQAFAHYQRGAYLTAFNLARLAADGGETKAKVLLARLWLEGIATGPDRQRALESLNEAALDDDPQALYLLGTETLRDLEERQTRSESDEKDIDLALDYFSRGSALGSEKARLQEANILLGSRRSPLSLRKAAKLLASMLHNPIAAYELGLLYLDGSGVATDIARGTALIQLAARQNLEIAQLHLGSLYFDGDLVARDEKMAIEWYRLAALQGHVLAQNQLARALASAGGENFDARSAAKWHLIARAQGMSDLWLDSFVAALPIAIIEDIKKEIHAYGY